MDPPTFIFQSKPLIRLPESSNQLWVDKHKPSIATIAVRPAKVKEVTAVLEALEHIKLLVLSGPAGSGKSTLIRVLAEARSIPVVEWETFMDRLGEPEYESSISKLERFLREATQYSPLGNAEHRPRLRRIILLDDLPYLGNDALQNRFHQLLSNYLASAEPFLLVLIVTEATMPIEGRRSDTQLTGLRDLIPQRITEHPACHVIEFNPITQSATVKALTRIYDAEKHTTSVFLTKDKIAHIAEVSRGDIRNAINTLQYYCVPSLASSRSRDNTKRRRIDMQISETRQEPLSLFHAVGKVLYAKRDPMGQLESQPEAILSQLPDTSHMVPYLYEHYLKFFSHIEDATRVINSICDGDYITSFGDWRDDVRREYEALISMYGTMARETHGRIRSQGMNGFGRPQYLDIVHQQKCREPTVGLWNRGAALIDDRSGEQEDEDDPIEDFSSDEEKQEKEDEVDYDKLFGDGADLAELDC